MARFSPLFSGSSGNCTYIATEAGGILIDAGVSAKRIETALSERGADPSSLKAILVTHEHTDHTAGVRVLAKRYHLPVFASVGTLQGMVTACDATTDVHVMPADGLEIAGMQIAAFPLSHDAAEPTGYVVALPNGRRVAVATDTGVVTDTIRQTLATCDVVLIESNHDLSLLRSGPYPAVLKQRIASSRGHLSNDACAALLPHLVSCGVTQLVLGHLSRENNTPQAARRCASEQLARAGFAENLDYRLTVAAPVSDQPLCML